MKIIDMHVHLCNRSRCSNLSAENINETLSKQIDGICLTDHWILNPKKKYSINVNVFYGVEFDCVMGDILAYGISSIPLRKRNLPANTIIDHIHKQGGIAVCAHPFSNRHDGFGKYVFDYDFDAIEVNGTILEGLQLKAKKAAIEMDIPTIGGSDAHSYRQLNTFVTKFEEAINSIDDIVKAVKNKECKAIKISGINKYER